MGFLTNFRPIFALLTPVDNSLTLFMVGIMVTRYHVLEKHKNIMTNSIILELLQCK